MRILFIVAIALLFSLVPPASCQEGPDIFPDEYTRKIARDLDLKSVKNVHIDATDNERNWNLTVTDPKVISLLIEGFKTANTTEFSNKTDYIEVIGKDGHTLLYNQFSIAYIPTLSSEFMEGLKAAGVEPKAWKEREERAKTQQESLKILGALAIIFAIGLLTFFIIKRKTRPSPQ